MKQKRLNSNLQVRDNVVEDENQYFLISPTDSFYTKNGHIVRWGDSVKDVFNFNVIRIYFRRKEFAPWVEPGM